MPFSSLVHRILPNEGEVSGAIIPLHGNHGGHADLLPLASVISGGRLIDAPEAARGIYEFRNRVSSSWYGGSEPHWPDPVSFGDSLAQLERFIHDVQSRSGESAPRPWLLGYEQGAVLASTIALIAPDLISGILAIDGGLPSFSNDSLLESMDGSLPILFIADSQKEEHKSHIESSASRLKEHGNQVTVHWMPVSTEVDSPVATVVKTFLDTHFKS